MAADCTVIAADHPEFAASEVLGDAGILVRPERTALAAALGGALAGERPTTAPRACAATYNWGSVAAQAETVYKKMSNIKSMEYYTPESSFRLWVVE